MLGGLLGVWGICPRFTDIKLFISPLCMRSQWPDQNHGSNQRQRLDRTQACEWPKEWFSWLGNLGGKNKHSLYSQDTESLTCCLVLQFRGTKTRLRSSGLPSSTYYISPFFLRWGSQASKLSNRLPKLTWQLFDLTRANLLADYFTHVGFSPLGECQVQLSEPWFLTGLAQHSEY